MQRNIAFTPEEKAFIKEHPVIHLGVDPKFIPYEFFDTDGIYSELGEGSTFNIRISLKADSNKDYEERKKSASIYFQNIRVLVVEKSLFYTNLLRDYMNSFNMVAEFAQSEDRAIQLMEDACKENGKPFNLLIVDHETPQNGGIEFYNKLKHLPKIKEMPKTILLIPISQEDIFDKLEVVGLNLGITKPIIPSILYNGIIEIFKDDVLEINDNVPLPKKDEQFVVDAHYHVLVVEDNKTNQFIVKTILEQAGFKVTLADKGKEGVENFSKNCSDFHLILMDLHMPVMNGFEASKLIREIDTKIPIIAMTADAITGVKEKCKDIGIDHYISKPFDLEKLLKTVGQIVKSQDSIGIELKTEHDIQDAIIHKEHLINKKQNLETPNILDVEASIKYIGGSQELYHMVIKEYYGENKDVLEILKKAIDAKDYKEAVQIVHKIKSSSGYIGAKTLYEVASKLQNSLKNEDTEEIERLYEEFSEILSKVLTTIDTLTSKLQNPPHT